MLPITEKLRSSENRVKELTKLHSQMSVIAVLHCSESNIKRFEAIENELKIAIDTYKENHCKALLISQIVLQ
mgnify:FL=1